MNEWSRRTGSNGGHDGRLLRKTRRRESKLFQERWSRLPAKMAVGSLLYAASSSEEALLLSGCGFQRKCQTMQQEGSEDDGMTTVFVVVVGASLDEVLGR